VHSAGTGSQVDSGVDHVIAPEHINVGVNVDSANGEHVPSVGVNDSQSSATTTIDANDLDEPTSDEDNDDTAASDDEDGVDAYHDGRTDRAVPGWEQDERIFATTPPRARWFRWRMGGLDFATAWSPPVPVKHVHAVKLTRPVATTIGPNVVGGGGKGDPSTAASGSTASTVVADSLRHQSSMWWQLEQQQTLWQQQVPVAVTVPRGGARGLAAGSSVASTTTTVQVSAATISAAATPTAAAAAAAAAAATTSTTPSLQPWAWSLLVEVTERRGSIVISVACPAIPIPRLLLPPAYAYTCQHINVNVGRISVFVFDDNHPVVHAHLLPPSTPVASTDTPSPGVDSESPTTWGAVATAARLGLPVAHVCLERVRARVLTTPATEAPRAPWSPLLATFPASQLQLGLAVGGLQVDSLLPHSDLPVVVAIPQDPAIMMNLELSLPEVPYAYTVFTSYLPPPPLPPAALFQILPEPELFAATGLHPAASATSAAAVATAAALGSAALWRTTALHPAAWSALPVVADTDIRALSVVIHPLVVQVEDVFLTTLASVATRLGAVATDPPSTSREVSLWHVWGRQTDCALPLPARPTRPPLSTTAMQNWRSQTSTSITVFEPVRPVMLGGMAPPRPQQSAMLLGVDVNFLALVDNVCAPRIFLHRFEISELNVRARIAAVLGVAFVSVQRLPLTFRPVNLSRVLCAPDRLVKELGATYLADALVRMPLLLGSLDVLGSPTVMFENLSHGLSDLVHGAGSGEVAAATAGLASFLQHTVTGVMGV
jgi:hypothetical protein